MLKTYPNNHFGCETVDDLIELLQTVPKGTKLAHSCDHAGITSYHAGISLSTNIKELVNHNNGWGFHPKREGEEITEESTVIKAIVF